jgi:hypothetical protein
MYAMESMVGSMQDVFVSVLKFSTAVTMFGMQQVQNAAGAITDTDAAQTKFRESLDAVTAALTAQLDATNRSATKSITDLGSTLVDRTMSAMDMPAMDPRNMMKTASDVLRKTTDSVSEIVQKTTAAAGSAVSSEPEAASKALGGKKN